MEAFLMAYEIKDYEAIKAQGYCMYHFSIKNLWILPTEFIYVFHVVLRKRKIIFLNSFKWLVFAMEMQCSASFSIVLIVHWVIMGMYM
jgi:hypothetical protein